MKLLPALALLTALLLLGCYSAPAIGSGGDAPLITTSKNFTIREDGQESFKLISGDSTEVHTVTASHIVPNAATLKIDSKSVTLTIGSTRSVSVNNKTIFITLDSTTDDYARFTISLSEGGQAPQGGGQQLLQNGAVCQNNSACASNRCNNSYCCASGACCISDSNCTVGKCNTTTYSCFTQTALSNGAPCNSNADCQSNHCNNGYCCVSGKCCLSASNCASGEICNSSYSCAPAPQVYTALDAERVANATANGTLMGRFASIFETGRQCSGGSSADKQCLPVVSVRAEKLSSSTFRVVYYYSFNGTNCCANKDLLVVTTQLAPNVTTTDQWFDNSITSSLADSMNSSLISNCASAIQYITCRTS